MTCTFTTIYASGLRDGDIITIAGSSKTYRINGVRADIVAIDELKLEKNLPEIKRLTAQYNLARVQRNRRLEKELLLKIKELGG